MNLDSGLAAELGSINTLLLIIAIALSVIALVSLGLIAVAAQLPKYLKSRMSFSDKAQLLHDQEKTDEVLTMCERRIEQYPGDAHAWWYLGQAAYRLEQFPRALNAMNKVVSFRPDWPTTVPFIEALEEKIAGRGGRTDLKIVPPISGQDHPDTHS